MALDTKNKYCCYKANTAGCRKPETIRFSDLYFRFTCEFRQKLFDTQTKMEFSNRNIIIFYHVVK